MKSRSMFRYGKPSGSLRHESESPCAVSSIACTRTERLRRLLALMRG
jgi:hypothetical protein